MRLVAVAMIAAGLALTAPLTSIMAQEPTSSGDAVDGEKDAEKKEKKEGKGSNFIPLPLFITEPAIGYGFGVALGYFHPKKNEAEPEATSISPAFTTGTSPAQGTDKEKKQPPTISGIAAAYTDNGTWAVGVGHSASWRKDRIRYKGALAYANINSTFYFLNIPFDFSLKGGLLFQDIRFRLGSSNFMLGPRLSYLNADGEFKRGNDAPVNFLERGVADSGLALGATWDTRDNTMTPDRGQFIELVAWRYDEALAGDYNYWEGEFKVLSFHEFSERFVLGFRLDIDAVDGDPPLWSYPWISLRGVPALRYQNEVAGVLETELRWNIFTRWAVVGFVGVGATRGDTRVYEDESGIVAGGVGGRYLFRPQDSLWVGVDIAKGPEDTYAYIQVGHAW
jgi:hypothetical protein